MVKNGKCLMLTRGIDEKVLVLCELEHNLYNKVSFLT